MQEPQLTLILSDVSEVFCLIPVLTNLFYFKHLTLNPMLNSILEQYREAQQRVNELYEQLRNTSDGYLYVTCLRCYGSLTWESHVNKFTVQELCDEYDGYNGIVDVYTTNPDHGIYSYGGVKVMSEAELQDMAKKDISMSTAVTNWITRSTGY
jgi:hypothetical protein